jgi:cytosine/adenosine deaminase-related metal-dependent hydrolase
MSHSNSHHTGHSHAHTHVRGRKHAASEAAAGSPLKLVSGSVAAPGIAGPGAAKASATLEQLRKASSDRGARILLKDGVVMSMDAKVGDFARGDVLIEGKKIIAVGPDLKADSALIVDVQDKIVMPGFVDTHHHQYETILRSILADGNLGLYDDPPNNYISIIQGQFTPVYRPEDVYISELIASLSQINAGVTTTTDTSQISHTPEHNDAAITALQESGHRVVYTYSPGMGPVTQYPQDIERVKARYFASDDQLLTLMFNAQPNIADWQLGKQLATPIICHIVGTRFGDLEEMGRAGLMGPDCTYIHCTNINDTTWKMIADTGGHISIAPAIEMQMRHGLPPFQRAIDSGIPVALSADVECNMTADFFTIMRAAFTIQRALVNERAIGGEKNLPKLFGSRDVIELATMGGARASHVDHKVGSLTPGKEADVIVLDTNRINVFPLNNAPGTVVTLMDTSNVEHVFIAGRPVKWAGDLVDVDLEKLRRLVDKSRDEVLARAKFAPNLFGTCV